MEWAFAEASPGSASIPPKRSPARPDLAAGTSAKSIGAGLTCEDSYRHHLHCGLLGPSAPEQKRALGIGDGDPIILEPVPVSTIEIRAARNARPACFALRPSS